MAFSRSVKRVQAERGSRAAYGKVEARGGFETLIDDDLRAFLREVDTGFLAAASAVGQPYIQHRGGPKGFIQALDDTTLAFVDFAGNGQSSPPATCGTTTASGCFSSTTPTGAA